jgi:hypothetical protein
MKPTSDICASLHKLKAWNAVKVHRERDRHFYKE